MGKYSASTQKMNSNLILKVSPMGWSSLELSIYVKKPMIHKLFIIPIHSDEMYLTPMNLYPFSWSLG